MLARLKNIEWKKLCKEKIWKQKKKQGSLDKQKAKAKKKKKNTKEIQGQKQSKLIVVVSRKFA